MCGAEVRGAGVFQGGVGDLGEGGEDRAGFLGEKSLEIGRAAQGRFPEMGGGRKEEIGSR